MARSDVVIVGAGPAGSLTAWSLARAGFSVTLVERARFPRRKVCGEYLNIGAVRLLDRLGLGATVRGAGSPLAGIRLVPPNGESVVLRFPEPALAIARETLDSLLLDAACAAGAQLVRSRVEDLEFDGESVSGVIARDEAGETSSLRARFIVGADGAGSVVARRLGVVEKLRGPRRFAVGGHYAGFGSMDRLVEMYVGAGAYFAVNPLDAQRANVMVVVRERSLAKWSRDIDEGVCGKAAELGRGLRSFDGTQRIGPRVAVGPLAFDTRRAHVANALLVGDAAGFLNPFTGQGVYLALSGALAAAGAVSSALAGVNPATAFARYDRERRAEVRKRRALSALVSTMLDLPLVARRATAKLSRVPSAADGLLAAISGIAPPESALRPATVARLLL